MKKISSTTPGRANTTLLAVGPNQDDLRSLRRILEADDWSVEVANSCLEARGLMKDGGRPTVIACERDLPDGDWKDVFNLISNLDNPPPMVVVSKHADETLWAEVLNLGGYDVLAKPFEQNEVSRVMGMASRFGRAEATLRY